MSKKHAPLCIKVYVNQLDNPELYAALQAYNGSRGEKLRRGSLLKALAKDGMLFRDINGIPLDTLVSQNIVLGRTQLKAYLASASAKMPQAHTMVGQPTASPKQAKQARVEQDHGFQPLQNARSITENKLESLAIRQNTMDSETHDVPTLGQPDDAIVTPPKLKVDLSLLD